MSVIKTKINKSPYKFIYINTNKDFKPDLNYKPRYRDKTDIEKRLEENPIIYVYNKDVYIVGYDVIRDYNASAPPYQHGIIKLWKNGKEFFTSNCEYIAYPCNIVVTSAND